MGLSLEASPPPGTVDGLRGVPKLAILKHIVHNKLESSPNARLDHIGKACSTMNVRVQTYRKTFVTVYRFLCLEY